MASSRDLKDLVKDAARGRWPEILADVGGIPREYLDGQHHPCPKCGGRDRFRLIDEEEGAVLCNGCFHERNGDGLAAIMWAREWKFLDALRAVAQHLGIPVPERASSRKTLDLLEWNRDLVALWCRHKPGVTPEAVQAFGGTLARWRSREGEYFQVIAIPIVGSRLEERGYALYNTTGAPLPTPSGPQKIRCTYRSQTGWLGRHAIKHIVRATVVWKVEGLSDALALWSAIPTEARELHVVVSNPFGAGERPPSEFVEIGQGKKVVVVGDRDKPGQEGALKWAKAFAKAGAETYLLELPKFPGKDLRDWLVAGGTFEELRTLARSIVPVALDSTDPLKPTVSVNEGDLDTLTRTAWNAIGEANAAREDPVLFRHGGVASRFNSDDQGGLHISTLNLDRITYHAAALCSWVRDTEEGEQAVFPPQKLMRSLLATPDPPLPILTRLVQSPVFAPDGSLILSPGYNPKAKVYFEPHSLVVPPVSHEPTREEIARALDLFLVDLLGDFPFCSPADKANCLALLILPYVRDMIQGATPLHLISKPMAGTGSGLLMDVISIVATGRAATIMTEGNNEEEWRKRLTAILMLSPTFLLIDNLRNRLDSASVSAAITASIWEDRVLGSSHVVHLPVRCAWVATGNNPQTSSEIARRTLQIRIDARVERPWLRDREGFRHPNLKAWVVEHRGELVWAALTLCQHWIACGRPKEQSVTIGSFESWVETMGGIVGIAGVPGFLDNQREFYDRADREGQAWRAFVASWWAQFSSQRVGAAQLWSIAQEVEFPMGTGNERAQKIRLGDALRRAQGRRFEIFEGESAEPKTLRLEDSGLKNRACQYCLVTEVNVSQMSQIGTSGNGLSSDVVTDDQGEVAHRRNDDLDRGYESNESECDSEIDFGISDADGNESNESKPDLESEDDL